MLRYSHREVIAACWFTLEIMKKLREKIGILWTKVLEVLPGGELRRCTQLSWMNTSCVKELNHRGKCEDAWFYRWNKKDGL
tara:strand:- start:398 stop:640 length:243 start_codon:yes stop_codon:yes gene_type:complete